MNLLHFVELFLGYIDIMFINIQGSFINKNQVMETN